MILGPFVFGAISVPFLLSAAVVLAMALYLLLVRGAPLLRGSFLVVALCVVPLVVNSALATGTDDPQLATWLYRMAVAPLPLAGTASLMFLLAIVDQVRAYARLLVVAALFSLAAGVVCVATPWIVPGVWRIPAGLLVQRGTVMNTALIGVIGVQVVLGGVVVLRQLRRETSPRLRRRAIGALTAFGISTLGSSDVLLSWGIGVFPVTWFFMTVGPLVALRSLVADDLLRARAIDRRAVLGLPYLAVVIAGLWLVARGGGSVPLLLVEMLALFVGLRALIGVGHFLLVAEAATDSPLERAFERHVVRMQSLQTDAELAGATAEVLRLTCGTEEVTVVVAAGGKWQLAGSAAPAPAAPDAALVTRWLAEAPVLLERDTLALQRAELRTPLEALCRAYRAEAIALLASGDQAIGLLAVGQLPGERALHPDELALVGRIADELRDGLEHLAILRDAQARASVQREVELAATVQEAFIPGRDPIALARLELCGAYEPATQCGGDWWSAHALPGGRSLVLIGDVTGHGLPAAMLTAAARGCVDVLLRVRGERLDLAELLATLDTVVRRRGNGQLHMTCFATLVDPQRGEVSFASAGHNVPYLMKAAGAELDVLVSRGDPLGASGRIASATQTRAVSPGDVIVWYTDGLVECHGPDGGAWGDRRFQRALKKLGANPGRVGALRDQLLAESAAHRAGVPAPDDITLVVARVQ